MNDKRTETRACDLIYRQDAIDALDKRFDSIPIEQTSEILSLRKDLRTLPSAQPERKTGEWILSDVQNPEDVRNGNYTYTCSNCLHSDIHAKTAVVPFCWHCGVDMSGADMRKEN